MSFDTFVKLGVFAESNDHTYYNLLRCFFHRQSYQCQELRHYFEKVFMR